jgi:hypothetical protein
MFYCVDKRVFVSFFKIILLRQFIQQYKRDYYYNYQRNKVPCIRKLDLEPRAYKLCLFKHLFDCFTCSTAFKKNYFTGISASTNQVVFLGLLNSRYFVSKLTTEHICTHMLLLLPLSFIQDNCVAIITIIIHTSHNTIYLYPTLFLFLCAIKNIYCIHDIIHLK